MNPYKPPDSPGEAPTRRRRLSGFRRGAIDGVLWSTPLVVMMTLFLSSYGMKPPSLFIAFLSSLQITAIWSAIAGLVAMVRDRNETKRDNSIFRERRADSIPDDEDEAISN